MINYNETLVSELKTILPTYYELFCTPDTPKPCITYMVLNDFDDKVGTTMTYSRIRFTIKLWGDDLEVLMPKCQEVDTKMRSLGFTRINTNDLVVDKQICKIFNYEGLGLELL